MTICDVFECSSQQCSSALAPSSSAENELLASAWTIALPAASAPLPVGKHRLWSFFGGMTITYSPFRFEVLVAMNHPILSVFSIEAVYMFRFIGWKPNLAIQPEKPWSGAEINLQPNSAAAALLKHWYIPKSLTELLNCMYNYIYICYTYIQCVYIYIYA